MVLRAVGALVWRPVGMRIRSARSGRDERGQREGGAGPGSVSVAVRGGCRRVDMICLLWPAGCVPPGWIGVRVLRGHCGLRRFSLACKPVKRRAVCGRGWW
jgi:hypothetical protein